MKTLTKFVESNKKHVNRLNQLIEPLKKHFGVDVFWHNTINEEGHLTSISSFQEPLEEFYQEAWYMKAGQFISPSLLRETRFFMDISGNFYKFQAKVQGKYSFHHPIMVQKKYTDDQIHQFCFASKNFSHTIPSTYLNNFAMFEQFIEYYLKDYRAHEKEIEDEGINLIELKGLDGFHGFNSESVSHLVERNCSFLKDIGVDNYLVNSGYSLSRRQQQVLLACVEGLTASQTAKELGLSLRTVEHYLDAVKDKLGVFNKKDLIKKGRILKISGLLDPWS